MDFARINKLREETTIETDKVMRDICKKANKMLPGIFAIHIKILLSDLVIM